MMLSPPRLPGRRRRGRGRQQVPGTVAVADSTVMGVGAGDTILAGAAAGSSSVGSTDTGSSPAGGTGAAESAVGSVLVGVG